MTNKVHNGGQGWSQGVKIRYSYVICLFIGFFGSMN